MSYDPSHRMPPRQERWPTATPAEGWPSYRDGEQGDPRYGTRRWRPAGQRQQAVATAAYHRPSRTTSTATAMAGPADGYPRGSVPAMPTPMTATPEPITVMPGLVMAMAGQTLARRRPAAATRLWEQERLRRGDGRLCGRRHYLGPVAAYVPAGHGADRRPGTPPTSREAHGYNRGRTARARRRGRTDNRWAPRTTGCPHGQPGAHPGDPMLTAPDAGVRPDRWQAEQERRREAGRRGPMVGAVTELLAIGCGDRRLYPGRGAAEVGRPRRLARMGAVFFERTPAALRNAVAHHFGVPRAGPCCCSACMSPSRSSRS